MKSLLQKPLVLLLIVLLAIGLVVFKVRTKPAIPHQKLGFPTRVVEVIEARLLPFRPRATAYGYVEPAVLLKAKSEVAGRIVYVNPLLKKGGSIAKGTVVVQIEPTTFEFSLDQSKAGLASSRSSLKQLETEEKSTRRSLDIARENLAVGEKELARLRKILKKGLIARSVVDAEEQKTLQLRQQVEDLKGKLATYSSRKAAIKSQIKQAGSQLAQSRDTLQRTEIVMPFDARIGTVYIEKGEFTGVGNILFEALGTQAVEINAQLPTRQFRSLLSGLSDKALDLQQPDGLQAAIKNLKLEAHVSLASYGETSGWQGELLRIGEAIDPTRDTIDLVVLVNNPYKGIIPGKHPPLLKGMYTAVEFIAPPTQQLVLPRRALHQGRVYVAAADDRLQIRPVKVLLKQGELIVVGEGIKAGERIIISDVIPVIEGLPLKPLENSEYEKQLAATALGAANVSGSDDNEGEAK
ncbi:MAG TPA: HlyD family secretion protein [Gammaproteobacteria bacterium]|nr:HlyD family secretion protein [Gammaproteobacteria bacterium]